MNLLLDTHPLIWLLEGSADLSNPALIAIEDTRNSVYVSVVSIWNTQMALASPLNVRLPP